jgi:hypothetical protein
MIASYKPTSSIRYLPCIMAPPNTPTCGLFLEELNAFIDWACLGKAVIFKGHGSNDHVTRRTFNRDPRRGITSIHCIMQAESGHTTASQSCIQVDAKTAEFLIDFKAIISRGSGALILTNSRHGHADNLHFLKIIKALSRQYLGNRNFCPREFYFVCNQLFFRLYYVVELTQETGLR